MNLTIQATSKPFVNADQNVTGDIPNTFKGAGIAAENVSLMNAFSNVTDYGLNISTVGNFSTENATVISTILFTSTSQTTYLEKVVFSVVGTIGFLGNLLVIFVFLRSPEERCKITNMLMLNQSIIDLFASIFVSLNKVFDDISWIKEPGPLAHYFCKLWLSSYFLWGSMIVSTFNLGALALERYFALLRPMLYKRYFTKTGARVTICIVWITGFAEMSYHIWSTELKGTVCSKWTEWPSKLFQSVFGVTIIFIEFIVPLCIMICCYSRIALMIHREAKMSGASEQREQKMLKARYNVIRTLLLVSVCFFLCWIWATVYYLIFNLGVPVNLMSPMYHFGVIICLTNCCINPFIYVFSYEAFRKSLKPAFCCVKQQNRSQTTSKCMSASTTVCQISQI